MNTSGQLSEFGIQANHEAMFAFFTEGITIAIAKVQLALRNNNELTDVDRDYLEKLLIPWTKANSPDFVLPQRVEKVENYAIDLRAYYYGQLRDPQNAFRWSWLHLQYSYVGMHTFQSALSDIADGAADGGDLKFARHAAELLLSHSDLLAAAANYGLAPTEDFTDGQVNWGEQDFAFEGLLPVSAALKCIALDPAPCWVRILELHARGISEEDQNRPHYHEVIATIRRYYAKTQQQE